MLYGYCAESCVGARLGAEYCEGGMLDAIGTRTRFSVLGPESSVANQTVVHCGWLSGRWEPCQPFKGQVPALGLGLREVAQ